ILMSKPIINVYDKIISFSYIFLFFSLISFVIIFFAGNPFNKKIFLLNFNKKIQGAMVSILMLSLPIIGGGTIFLSIVKYKQKHLEIIDEKLQSIYLELSHRLEFENTLIPGGAIYENENLNDLLIKLSNVFYTDINMYNRSGELTATSRSEIFSNGLVSKKMNIDAYIALDYLKKAVFIHEEKIGELNYLSAYVPFFNRDGNLLAYLNVPYFTRQDELKKDISTLVAGILNIYVLLFLLTLVIAFTIANRLSQPLRLIQRKISEIELGKNNEKIEYKGYDEIGSLVNEYNQKVDELAKSTELLAKSERESAWREMAKQIAHEIKNPLTPMKLSVQHLNRTWKNQGGDWEVFLDKFTKKIIDQIDNLSSIANEFSTFAKMPTAKNEKVDVLERITSVVDLFGETPGVSVKMMNEETKPVWVFTDKEYLTRVFVNLIKNATQAIPADRKGVIVVRVSKNNSNAIIEIEDNGTGIPPEMTRNLFQPNFTTKSSGMGLGLAITKKIIEDAGGDISFETNLDKGTKFMVKLPLHDV
ncbi:MAG: ATP-binding protein, partial [bacterium]